jgi:hypothetical protein
MGSNVVAYNGDIKNFWELNPQFKNFEPFKTLYKEDIDKKKVNSSKTMWFLWHCFDPTSILFTMDVYEKRELVGKDYLNDISFYENNKEWIDYAETVYDNITLSPIKKLEKGVSDAINERNTYFRSVPYSPETVKEKDSMLISMDKILATWNKLQTMLEKENEKTKSGRGDSALSLSDQDNF